MLIYKDKLNGDELFSDSYPIEEVADGFFYQVQGKWVELGDVVVDTGANASAEEAAEELDSSARKVVDLVDSHRLNETSSYDKKAFMAYIKGWLAKLMPKLSESEQAELKTKAPGGTKYLLAKLKDLQFFTGESMDPDATMVYAYYPDGATDPVFLFPKYALDEQKC